MSHDTHVANLHTRKIVGYGARNTSCELPQEIISSKLFEGLHPNTILDICAYARVEHLKPNNIVINDGDVANHLFIVTKGQAKFYKLTKLGDEMLLLWLTSGDVFGLGSLLTAAPCYFGTAETLSECEIWRWGRASIRHFATLHPVLAENALYIVLQYIHNYVGKQLQLTSRSAEPRLAGALLSLAGSAGLVLPGGVQLDVTNEQLALLAHISSFTVSRLLNRWKRKGIISKERRKVLVRTPEALLID